MVNGRKITSTQAGAGDLVTCGRLEIRVEAVLPAPPTHSEPKPPPTLSGLGPWELIYTDPAGQDYGLEIQPGDDWVIIGRMPDVNLCVAERSVGRRHVRVGFEGGRLVAIDLKSTNGTFLNGERVPRAVLSAGDVLRLGDVDIAVHGPPPAEPEDLEESWHDGWDETWEEGQGAPPEWYLLYIDETFEVQRETMSSEARVLAIGADEDCEISATGRGLERDHCEITWEEGVLIAKDLDSEAGTYLKDRRIDERVIRNGDVVRCGSLEVHVLRGPESTRTGLTGEIRSDAADTWSRFIHTRDDSLCVVFALDDPDQAPDRVEFTLWGDGESRLELVADQTHTSVEARLAPAALDLLLEGLLGAGFPDTPPARLEDGESTSEVTAFHDQDQISINLGRAHLARSVAYRAVLETVRCVVSILRASMASGTR